MPASYALNAEFLLARESKALQRALDPSHYAYTALWTTSRRQRLVMAFGDTTDIVQHCWGTSLQTYEWPTMLIQLRQKVQAATQYFYNCALVEVFLDGKTGGRLYQDASSGHAATVFLGPTRDLHVTKQCAPTFSPPTTCLLTAGLCLKAMPAALYSRIELVSGSLLAVQPVFHDRFKAVLPDQPATATSNINVTFRHFEVDPGSPASSEEYQAPF